MGSVRYNGVLYEGITDIAVHNHALLLKRGSRTILLPLNADVGENILLEIVEILSGYSINKLEIQKCMGSCNCLNLSRTKYRCVSLLGSFDRLLVDNSEMCYTVINWQQRKPVVNKESSFSVHGYSSSVHRYDKFLG